MEHNSIDKCIDEWGILSNEYRTLQKLHKSYQSKLEEVNDLQQKCIKSVAHQRYRINIIKNSMKKLDKRASSDTEEAERRDMLQTDLIRRKAQLYEMENSLPKPNGTYLSIIVGNVNTSMLDKNQKFSYKNEYEKFKLVMSLISLGSSLINSFTNIRTLDLIHMFLLVWYFCTLTIRESILKVNGSRISGWWRAHHFISTVLSAVMLVWPIGDTYYAFRSQFMYFNVYISIVQYMQFIYQRGVLYRMKALGQSQQMDITMEGFQSWMWKSLSFLLPILFLGYFMELYHAYTLWGLSWAPGADWHEPTLCLLFLILFLGNSLTTAATIPKKLQDRLKLKYRFTKLDKYMWTHKKRRVSFRNPEGSPLRRTVLPDVRAAEAPAEDSVVRRRVIEPQDATATTAAAATPAATTATAATPAATTATSADSSTSPDAKDAVITATAAAVSKDSAFEVVAEVSSSGEAVSVETTSSDVEATSVSVEATSGGVEDTSSGVEAASGDVQSTSGGMEAANGGVEATVGGMEPSSGSNCVESTSGSVEATSGNGGAECDGSEAADTAGSEAAAKSAAE